MKWWRGKGTALILGTILVLAAACSRTPQSVGPLSPTPQGSVPNSAASPGAPGNPSSPQPSGASAGSPRPGPSPNSSQFPLAPAPGVESKGTASIEGAGWTMDLAFDTVVDYPYYSGQGRDASIVWMDNYGNTMALGGKVFLGTKRTGGGAMVLAINTTTDPRIQVNSGDGSCRVTITRADPNAIEGSFNCPEATGGPNRVYDVSGTFKARFPK